MNWDKVRQQKIFRTRGSEDKLYRSRKPRKKKRQKAVIPAFYDSVEWKQLRYQALTRSNGHCMCCGAGPEHGAVLNVDHIKPRLKYPALALELGNLQVLCAWCNEGKGGKDQRDWRPKRLEFNPIDTELDLLYLSVLREAGLL